ncbi:MAG TPA: hypothetical protein VK797_29680 [Tepidisphaeraceae bacterium]|nr:hypothetical protein [Tepidisphaeraceae bacterium]
MMASTAEQPPAQPPPEAKKLRRRPLRRWLWRITAFVIGLALVLAIFFQIVLWTGLPRSIVVSIVEKGLGVRMAATGLSTGWLGHTTLHGVRLALPLSQANQAFLEIPEMRVNHTNLVALLCGSDITIKEIDLGNPVLHVSQDASGQWNLSQVAELIMRVAGRKTGEQTAATSATAALPRLQIDGMTIDVVDNRHRELKIAPINVNGAPDTPVSWKYDLEVPSGLASVPPHLSLLGKLAPGGVWAHDAHLWVHDVGDWIRVWKPQFDMPLTLDADWTGQLTANGVSGFMKISDAQLGAYHADGAFAAEQAGDVYTVSPQGLRVRTGDPVVSEIRSPKGVVSYDGKVVKATRLQLALLSGISELNGWYEPDINQGAVEAYWDSLKLDKIGVTHSGKLNATYSNPTASNLEIALTANTSGSAPDGPFEAVLKLNLTGRNWTELAWKLETPQLAWHRPQPIILDGVMASGSCHLDPGHELVRLDAVSLPTDARLAGNGYYDFVTKEGQLHLSGQEWPVHLIEGTRLEFALDATAQGVAAPEDPKQTKLFLQLTQFYLRGGDADITATGTYDGRTPKPVSADVVFQNRPGTSFSTENRVLQGFIRGHVTLNGTLKPLDLALEGDLDGSAVVVSNRMVGDLSTTLTGGIDYQKAFLRARGISFLEGLWTVGATYVTHRNDRPVFATEINLSIEHLPLSKLGAFVGSPPIDGIFDGRWYIYYPGLKPKASQIILTGRGEMKNLIAAPFVADSVTFDSTLRNGTLVIDPIRINRGSYGRIDATARLDLADWHQLLAGVQLTAFPLDLTPQLALQLNGGTKQIQVFLPDARSQDPLARQLRVNTDINVRTSVAANEQPLGEIRLLAGMHDRTVDLREIQGDLLGGKITGDAVVHIDDLDGSRANLAWEGLQSERFARLYPDLREIGGTYSGDAHLSPATVERPLGPLALDVHLRPANGHWRSIQFGNGELHAFLDTQTHQFVASDSAPTRMAIADGLMDFWFSGSRHVDTAITPEGNRIETGVTISNQFNITLTQLSIDQIVHAFDPKHATGSGRLSGQIYTLSAPRTSQLVEIAQAATGGVPHATTSATAPTTRPNATTSATALAKDRTILQDILATATVDGALEIDHSDLGNFAPVAFLYNLMHLGGNIRAQTGNGTIALIMESGTLHVTNLSYFNRGIEVHGVINATRMWELPDNPIEGSIVGAARPLKNIKLPLFAETDTIFNQLQLQLSSVEFKGIVANPTRDYQRPLNLSQAGAELRGLLLGEVNSNPRE